MIKKYLPKSEFAKNVLTLMTGTTIGQAIPVLVSPIVTRLYSPEEYGVFAIFLSITAILSVISTGRYEFAIVVTEEEETALNLTALSIVISFFLSVFSFALVVAFDSEFADLLGQPEIAVYLYFVPLALFLNGVYQTLAQLLNRKKEYSIISAGKIAQPTLTATTQISFGFFKYGNGLIFGNLFGIVISTALLFSKAWKLFKTKLFQFSVENLKSTALQYKDLPRFSVVGSLLNSLSFNLVNLFLSFLFNPVFVGFYALIFRVLSSPAIVIGTAVGQVYLEQASSEKKKTGNSFNTFKYTSQRLLLAGIPIFTLIYFFIEDVFGFVFGEQWKPAGSYARILLPLFFVRFISTTLSGTLNVYEKWRPSLLIHTSLLVATIVTFFISDQFHFSFEQFLYLNTYLLSALYLVFYFYYYRISRK